VLTRIPCTGLSVPRLQAQTAACASDATPPIQMTTALNTASTAPTPLMVSCAF
jgi:hypothetical protein